jgi:hypothetical protein
VGGAVEGAVEGPAARLAIFACKRRVFYREREEETERGCERRERRERRIGRGERSDGGTGKGKEETGDST